MSSIPSWLTLMAALTCMADIAGCYTSDYVLRKDGRARVSFDSDGPKLLLFSPLVSSDCILAIREAYGEYRKPQRKATCLTGFCQDHFWNPRFFYRLPEILPPSHQQNSAGYPVFSPVLLSQMQWQSDLSKITSVVMAGNKDSTIGHSIMAGGPGILGVGIGFFTSLWMMPISVFAQIITDWSLGDVYMQDAGSIIDVANIYNDLARSPGSACAYEAARSAP